MCSRDASGVLLAPALEATAPPPPVATGSAAACICHQSYLSSNYMRCGLMHSRLPGPSNMCSLCNHLALIDACPLFNPTCNTPSLAVIMRADLALLCPPLHQPGPRGPGQQARVTCMSRASQAAVHCVQESTELSGSERLLSRESKGAWGRKGSCICAAAFRLATWHVGGRPCTPSDHSTPRLGVSIAEDPIKTERREAGRATRVEQALAAPPRRGRIQIGGRRLARRGCQPAQFGRGSRNKANREGQRRY